MTRFVHSSRFLARFGCLLALAVCLVGFAGCKPAGPEPVEETTDPATTPPEVTLPETAPADTPPAEPAPSDATSADEPGAEMASSEPPPMLLTEVPSQGGQAQQPSLPGMPPAGQPPETTVSPEAQPILDAMRAAYRAVESLELEGQVNVAVSAGPESQTEEKKFTAAFQAPNKFVHDAEEEMLAGSDGTQAYLFSRSENVYMTSKLSGAQRSLDVFPPQIIRMVQMQNPSVFFAFADMPMEEVLGPGLQITKLDDQTVDGKAYQALLFTMPGGQGSSQMLVDPETHLLRRIVTDMTPLMRRQGMNVQKAELTIDYPTTNIAPEFAPDRFAWTPPEGAMDVAEAQRRQQAEREAQEVALRQMPGKPAPDFTLTGLDGQPVSLAGLQGQVVVLDFWATWCGPCVSSLPHLAELAKERAAQGVKVFALNIQETEEEVSAFVKEHGLELTVLLDKDGDVASKYNVSGIPQTVVIGTDGLVRKVFVGSGQDVAIAAQVDAALAGLPIDTEPGAEEPAMETPAGETPAAETPAAETPAAETPAAETPAAETPAADTPATGEAPAMETPAAETPAAETPAPETPAAETPAMETPAAETPASETPAPETPAPETPASENPAPEQP